MYSLDILIQGFPGKSEDRGGLGWSTVPLLRGHGEVVLIDTGSYSYRVHPLERLGQLGLSREDITSVVLTHCHWDHICNYPLFPEAKVFVPHHDLEWAASQPVGTWHIPEFHVEKLDSDQRVMRISEGDGFLQVSRPRSESYLPPYSSVRAPTESKGCGKRCIRKPCCMDAPALSCPPSALWTWRCGIVTPAPPFCRSTSTWEPFAKVRCLRMRAAVTTLRTRHRVCWPKNGSIITQERRALMCNTSSPNSF